MVAYLSARGRFANNETIGTAIAFKVKDQSKLVGVGLTSTRKTLNRGPCHGLNPSSAVCSH